MFADFRILTLGMATVLDTVLLLSMLRRPNWRFLPIWMALLTGGAWLWHFSTFVRSLIEGAAAPWAMFVQSVCMLLMTGGLLLMPAAMLHGVARLWRTGIAPPPRPNYFYLLFYLPLIAIAPAVGWLRDDPSASYMELMRPLVLPYACWVTAVNLLSALMLLGLRQRLALPGAARLGAAMAIILILMTVGLDFVVLFGPTLSPAASEAWQLAVTLSPAAPALTFAYFIVRFRFMSLILERTLAYGAIVTGLLLVHRLMIRNLAAKVDDRYHVDLEIIEGALAIVLVLAYPPLRRRAAEALRYLLGSRSDRLRGETRRLAVEMSELAGQPPEELLGWFVETLAAALHVEYVAGWLFSPTGGATARRGDSARIDDSAADRLRTGILAAGARFCDWSAAPTPGLAEIMEHADASLAVVIAQQNVRGLLLVGRQKMQQQPGDEETSTLVLLVEQLAGAMSNSLLQSERMLAERRALQNEKLSTLGLLAGSIAHEVKNPLSSIKTIASVMAEDLGPDSNHSEDLRLILSEIDRLATTTSQLLDFARPTSDATQGLFLPALDRTLRIMRHVARERDVTIEGPRAANLPTVSADENSLREIFFNLLTNSIDAAGRGGRVSIDCRQENGFLITEFRDTGPGIPPSEQDRLFEPFFTTKPHGNGLGLYVVARRVRELGGEICCRSASGQGTSFIVKLPHTGDHA